MNMLGINKNKIKLSKLGIGGLEIEELFEDLNAEEITYITEYIKMYIELGKPIDVAIELGGKTDLMSKKVFDIIKNM